jgi:hypothetical protein
MFAPKCFSMRAELDSTVLSRADAVSPLEFASAFASLDACALRADHLFRTSSRLPSMALDSTILGRTGEAQAGVRMAACHI